MPSSTDGLLNLLDEIGIEDIQPRDDEIHARCPKHEERTGMRESRTRHWSVNRVTGMHHCFSCGYKGSLVRLVMDCTDKGMWDAQTLVYAHGVELGVTPPPAPEPEPEVRQSVRERYDGMVFPPRRAMLHRRLAMASVVNYDVAWDDEESGWVVPIRSPEGEFWGYQLKLRGRAINYPPKIQKSKTLFGLDYLRERSHWALLVESPLDVVFLHGLGLPAVASFGAYVSEPQMRLMVRNFSSMTLALDNDEAGQRNTERLLGTGWYQRIPISLLSYQHTRAKDPGEMTAEEAERAVADADLWYLR